VNNIENVTKTPDTGNGGGKPEAEAPTPQPPVKEPVEERPQENNQEGLEAKLRAQEEEIANLRKAVAGFQPGHQKLAIQLQRAETERDSLREQLEEARNSDYESPNEGVLTAQLRRTRRDLMESRAQARASQIVARYPNIPTTLRDKIAANPLAHIEVPNDATEDTIALDIAEQLPSYLDNLVEELGTGNSAPEPQNQEGPQAPPAPGGGSPSGGRTIYADEIDPKTPGGYRRFKELKEDIESGKIGVLPKRTR